MCISGESVNECQRTGRDNSGFQAAWSLENDRLGSGGCAVEACVLAGVCISGRGMRMGMGGQRLPERVVSGERPPGQR